LGIHLTIKGSGRILQKPTKNQRKTNEKPTKNQRKTNEKPTKNQRKSKGARATAPKTAGGSMRDRSSSLRRSFDYLNLLLTGCPFGSTCASRGEAIRGESRARALTAGPVRSILRSFVYLPLELT
jgi:hypothetical protein